MSLCRIESRLAIQTVAIKNEHEVYSLPSRLAVCVRKGCITLIALRAAQTRNKNKKSKRLLTSLPPSRVRAILEPIDAHVSLQARQRRNQLALTDHTPTTTVAAIAGDAIAATGALLAQRATTVIAAETATAAAASVFLRR
jgi:hypothetical protein